MNGAGRTYTDAFAAGFALRRVYVCEVVGHLYGSEGALLGAFAAAYASGGAYLARHGAFIAA